jgi:hypothetical protein
MYIFFLVGVQVWGGGYHFLVSLALGLFSYVSIVAGIITPLGLKGVFF